MENTKIVISQIMLPFQASFAGNVHGGEILKTMDLTAEAVATKYAKANVVTVRVEEIQFILPIFVGAYLTCTGTIAYVGRSSMEIIVEVDVEDLTSGIGPQRALSAFFTLVALDRNQRPMQLPPLLPETDEEKELYELAWKRRESYQSRRKKT